jgi:hypothetical protein
MRGQTLPCVLLAVTELFLGGLDYLACRGISMVFNLLSPSTRFIFRLFSRSGRRPVEKGRRG